MLVGQLTHEHTANPATRDEFGVPDLSRPVQDQVKRNPVGGASFMLNLRQAGFESLNMTKDNSCGGTTSGTEGGNLLRRSPIDVA